MKTSNIIAARRRELYDSLDREIQKELDDFFAHRVSTHQLQVFEKSKNSPCEGDVFLVSPRPGIYFYGKVLVASIVRTVPDSFVEGNHVVFIFKSHTKEKTLDNYKPNYDDLLIPPAIVSQHYWTKGYFYWIANLPLTEVERQLDFGFYKIHFKGNFFCKETGEVLEKEPDLLGMHGITTLTGIASEIERELIINPGLLS